MAETLYKKVGRRYVAVGNIDRHLGSYMPNGSYLVTVNGNSTRTSSDVEPANAPVIAACHYGARVAEDVLLHEMEYQSPKHPLTKGQFRAWKRFQKEMGEEMTLPRKTAFEVLCAFSNAIEKEVTETMQHPAVKEAYDKFMFVWQLAKQEKKDEN